MTGVQTCALPISRNVVEGLRKQGKKIGMLRPISLWPFPEKELKILSEKVDKFLVVEMSCWQMVEDVKLGIECKRPVHFYGRSGGGLPTEDEIMRELMTIYSLSLS